MNVIKTAIDGVLIIESKVFEIKGRLIRFAVWHSRLHQSS